VFAGSDPVFAGFFVHFDPWKLPFVVGKALRTDDDDDETRGILDGAAIGVNEPDREDQVGNSGRERQGG
jgi:hypothetical protein